MFSALHDCGHVSLWRTESVAPQIGEHMTCARCGAATRVTDLFGPWRAECLNCGRVNHHATFQRTIMRHAVRHVQEWTTHRVRVWQYGDKDSVRVLTATVTGAQPGLFSDAPF